MKYPIVARCERAIKTYKDNKACGFEVRNIIGDKVNWDKKIERYQSIMSKALDDLNNKPTKILLTWLKRAKSSGTFSPYSSIEPQYTVEDIQMALSSRSSNDIRVFQRETSRIFTSGITRICQRDASRQEGQSNTQ